MTRAELQRIPTRLATDEQPGRAKELWLLPTALGTTIIAVDYRQSPSHHVVAYATKIVLEVGSRHNPATIDTVAIAKSRTSVTRLRAEEGGAFTVHRSSAWTYVTL